MNNQYASSIASEYKKQIIFGMNKIGRFYAKYPEIKCFYKTENFILRMNTLYQFWLNLSQTLKGKSSTPPKLYREGNWTEDDMGEYFI